MNLDGVASEHRADKAKANAGDAVDWSSGLPRVRALKEWAKSDGTAAGV